MRSLGRRVPFIAGAFVSSSASARYVQTRTGGGTGLAQPAAAASSVRNSGTLAAITPVNGKRGVGLRQLSQHAATQVRVITNDRHDPPTRGRRPWHLFPQTVRPAQRAVS